MSRGPYPIMLMLAMALPGTVRALGLGEIRVDSALNEPLSAQIEIVGATRDELMALTAKVAPREIFQRYGADRPAFLATATFKVGLDSQGHPVLNVRSGEAFTDPLVHFLVDLRWGPNDLIRDYSLLLDPAGFNSPRQGAEAAPPAVAQALPAPATAIDRVSATPAGPAKAAQAGSNAQESPSTSPLQYRITARDTLRGIARRSGARSESHVQRMMIAIFRGNPAAFDGNINRLHRGALLTMPTPAEWAAISATDAKREVRAQMTAWRLDGRRGSAAREAAAPKPAPALGAGASAARGGPAAATATLAAAGTATLAAAGTDADPPPASLQSRVEFLEQALQDMHRQLAVHNAKLHELDARPATQRTAAPAPLTSDASQPESTPDAGAQPTVAAATEPLSGSAFLGPIAAGVTLLLAGFAYARGRRRRQLTPAAATLEAAPDAAPDAPVELVPAVAATESERAAPASTAALAEDATPDADAVFEADVGFAAEAALTAAATGGGTAAAQSKGVSTARPAASPAPRPFEPTTQSADDTKSNTHNTRTTVVLEIDAEALERSYLDSLGIDTTTFDDTREQAVDTARLDAIVEDSDSTAKNVATNVTTNVATHPAATAAGSHGTPAGSKTPAADINTTVTDAIDLEATVEHVQMPSGLNDRAVVSERRANIVDALKMAIDRDPHRGDLRMKLLETYFSATVNSRHAFTDAVRKLAHERDRVSAEDWLKVVKMGREIAADDGLFADSPVDKPPGRLADCA